MFSWDAEYMSVLVLLCVLDEGWINCVLCKSKKEKKKKGKAIKENND